MSNHLRNNYTATRILQILLGPSIDQSIIAKGRPIQVERSSTFVVDLTCLKHPDDVKKRTCMDDGTIVAPIRRCLGVHLMNLMIFQLKNVLQVPLVKMCTTCVALEAATPATLTSDA